MRKAPVVFDTKPCVMELDAGDHWWCSCGLSYHQPLCDGSHTGTGLAPRKFTLPEKRRVSLCNCKHSCNPPFCDGTHAKLTGEKGGQQ